MLMREIRKRRETVFMDSKTQTVKSVNSHEIDLEFRAVLIKIPANIVIDIRVHKLTLKCIHNATSPE